MTEEERLLSGQAFNPYHPELKAMKGRAHRLYEEYNRTSEREAEKRRAILEELLGGIGEKVSLQGPVYFNYGKHTFIGEDFFGNYNLCIQDDAYVRIGNHVQFGPDVLIATAEHPLIAEERQYWHDGEGGFACRCKARPVTIGDNVWLGARVTVCPGVTIGQGAVIGAGSVVTRDIPGNTVAAGVPCRVIRNITEEDSWERQPL